MIYPLISYQECPKCHRDEWAVSYDNPIWTVAHCVQCSTMGIFDPMDKIVAEMKRRNRVVGRRMRHE